ncbi:hypothetical protein R6Q59_006700 [Mikania micrantha]
MQDPGTYPQLILETAVIEILSLPITATQIISAFVQIIVKIVKIQPHLIQSNDDFHTSSSSSDTSSANNDSSEGYGSNPLTTMLHFPNSVLVIQACGLLLAQLPVEFHINLYEEVSHVIKNNESPVVGHSLLDPTWAAHDNTSTALGNTVALIHAFFWNLPQQWLDNTHLLINQLRPVSSISMLRITFRIIGPLLPRLANAHSLFLKTLELLLSVMVDVFGKNAKLSTPVEASDIVDLIDFLHHVVHYEGQGGPVQPSSKPRADVLDLCGRAIENMRSDVQHLLSHLKPDINCSIYAAANLKHAQNPS